MDKPHGIRLLICLFSFRIFLIVTFTDSFFYIFWLIVNRFHSYVERLLDRISNGQLAEDRRAAMVELQSVVAENRSAQLPFGAMGMCFTCYLTIVIWIVLNL